MKQFLATFAVIALVMAPLALAGDYHTGSTLICSDCHIMHASQAHGYNADGSGNYAAFDATPHEYLLRNSPNALCLSCHDGQSWAPDVLYTNTNSDVRAAGALNMPGFGLDPTGHTLGSTDVAPGGTWSNAEGLECVDCHQQHGYNPNGGNPYRNLHYSPGGAYAYPGIIVDYAVGTNDLTKDVYEVTDSGASHYSWDNVFYNEPDSYGSDYVRFCGGCHTNFHGLPGDANMGGATGTEWLRHPVSGADIGAQGGGHSSLAVFQGHTNQVKVMSASGDWTGANNDLTPSCMSCHKAHGNQNAFALIFMSGTGTVTEEGDDGTQVGDLCGQCHVQGN